MIHLPPSMGASLRFSLAASRASHKPTVQRILESSERYCVSLFVSTFATISAVGPTRRPLPGPSRATTFQNALMWIQKQPFVMVSSRFRLAKLPPLNHFGIPANVAAPGSVAANLVKSILSIYT
jgi:hypothetical protein